MPTLFDIGWNIIRAGQTLFDIFSVSLGGFYTILGWLPSQANLIILEWAWFDYFTVDESILYFLASDGPVDQFVVTSLSVDR